MRQVASVEEVFKDISLKRDGRPVDMDATRDKAIDGLLAALETRFTDRAETADVIQALQISNIKMWPSRDDDEGKILVSASCQLCSNLNA